MKRFIAFILSMALLCSCFTGCGTSYNAQESTLYVLKNGKIVSTDVEEFDSEQYSESDFKEYVLDAVANYNALYGSGSVELKKFKIKNGIATIILGYKSANHYMTFNGVNMFAGTIAEAKDSGFRFEGDFAAIHKNQAVLCGSDDFTDHDDYKVAILDVRGLNVKLPSNVLYATVQDIELVDEKTLAVFEGNNLVEEEADTTETEKTADGTEGTEASDTEMTTETDASISEDELLAAAEESAVPDGKFFEDKEAKETASYIYIIYK